MVVLSVFSKVVSGIKSRFSKNGEKRFLGNKLKVVSDKKTSSVKRFFALSKPFSREYRKTVLTAAHLISANLKRLKAGEVIVKNGFEIRRASTGESHKGRYNDITLSVSFEGKTLFVKIGSHTGKEHYLGYKKARSFFNHRRFLSFFGYKAKVVPYHLFYNKSSSSKSQKSTISGFLVSDFFPKERVALIEDIENSMGHKEFESSKLGQAIEFINNSLLERSVFDAGSHNAFLDEKSKTIYFFDLFYSKSNLASINTSNLLRPTFLGSGKM